MRCKLLFSIRDFRQGGVPRCLQSLLQHLDTERYEVQLFVMHQDGPYRGNMPNCTVLPEDKMVRSLLTYRADASLWDKVQKSIRTIGRKLFKWDLLEWRFRRIARKIDCDVAIAYTEGFPAQFISCVSARKKLIWIHNDYKWVQQAGEGTDFSLFDRIVCVSECTRQSFVEVLPRFAERTMTLHNVMNLELIREQANDPIEDSEFLTDKPVVLSIGRVCYQKNFVVIPKVASELAKMMDFRWYIIGSGPENEVKLVRDGIEKWGVEDKVILLGPRDNPYKYLARSQVFVLTSNYESYPTVINEALILNVPVVSNDIPSAHEMLVTGKVSDIENLTGHKILAAGNGLISDIDHIADAIIAAQSLKVEFVDENEAVMKKLEGEWYGY